jgi:hypothetical protein
MNQRTILVYDENKANPQRLFLEGDGSISLDFLSKRFHSNCVGLNIKWNGEWIGYFIKFIQLHGCTAKRLLIDECQS